MKKICLTAKLKKSNHHPEKQSNRSPNTVIKLYSRYDDSNQNISGLILTDHSDKGDVYSLSPPADTKSIESQRSNQKSEDYNSYLNRIKE